MLNLSTQEERQINGERERDSHKWIAALRTATRRSKSDLGIRLPALHIKIKLSEHDPNLARQRAAQMMLATCNWTFLPATLSWGVALRKNPHMVSARNFRGPREPF